MTIRLVTIPGGTEGARATVDRIRVLALEPSTSVAQIAATLRASSAFTTAGAIYTWVQQRMLYRPDDPRMEEIKAPDYLLWEIGNQGKAEGDCDDYVTLMAALLHAVGINPLIVLVGPADSEEFAHVYLRIPTEIGPVAADAIHEEPFGWEIAPHLIGLREETPLVGTT